MGERLAGHFSYSVVQEHHGEPDWATGAGPGGGYRPGGLTSTTRTEILHHGNACVTMMA